MRRREFIVALATMLGNRAAFGQNAKSKRLIGVLMGATNDAEAAARGSVFEDALRKLGWRTGENVSSIDLRPGTPISFALIRPS